MVEVHGNVMYSIYHTAPANGSLSPIIVGFFLGIVSGVVLNWIGNCITYHFQGKSKERDVASTSKEMLRYIYMVLCLQRSKLVNIEKSLEERKKADSSKLNLLRIEFNPIVVTIKEEYLQKVLAHPAFAQSTLYPEALQAIVNAETIYQKCIFMIDQLNEHVDPDKYLKADGKALAVYSQIRNSILQSIELNYQEAIATNEIARTKVAAVGRDVFGGDFKLPRIGEVVKATDL
ncbi:MAG: hypothetical protein KIT56_03540 [Gammaproteobacteria bacterium]|nr:hypothetical protein [Gammaproteobacteria bacterium]MCW5582951.1 hypothetical protein [Gammaproteobacteria bacterium]